MFKKCSCINANQYSTQHACSVLHTIASSNLFCLVLTGYYLRYVYLGLFNLLHSFSLRRRRAFEAKAVDEAVLLLPRDQAKESLLLNLKSPKPRRKKMKRMTLRMKKKRRNLKAPARRTMARIQLKKNSSLANSLS